MSKIVYKAIKRVIYDCGIECHNHRNIDTAQRCVDERLEAEGIKRRAFSKRNINEIPTCDASKNRLIFLAYLSPTVKIKISRTYDVSAERIDDLVTAEWRKIAKKLNTAELMEISNLFRLNENVSAADLRTKFQNIY